MNIRTRGEERERERERETKLAYINIYVCTEAVTMRLRACLAQAGYLTLHALTHTHTHRQRRRGGASAGARGFPLTEAARAYGKTTKGGFAEEGAATLT